MNIEELEEEMRKLNQSIKRLLEKTGYLSNHSIDEVEQTDETDLFFRRFELEKLIIQLGDIHENFSYLQREIKVQGRLYKNENGRYQIDDYVLNAGRMIEFLSYDDFHEKEVWKISRIEYNDGYYLFHHKDIPMDGLFARIRS